MNSRKVRDRLLVGLQLDPKDKTVMWTGKPPASWKKDGDCSYAIWKDGKSLTEKKSKAHIVTYEISTIIENGLTPQHVKSLDIPMGSVYFAADFHGALEKLNILRSQANAVLELDWEDFCADNVPEVSAARLRGPLLSQVSGIVLEILSYGDPVEPANGILNSFLEGFGTTGYYMPRPDLCDNFLESVEVTLLPADQEGSFFTIFDRQDDIIDTINFAVWSCLHPLVDLCSVPVALRPEMEDLCCVPDSAGIYKDRDVLVKIVRVSARLFAKFCFSLMWSRSNYKKKYCLGESLSATTYSAKDEHDVCHLNEFAAYTTQVAKAHHDMKFPFKIGVLFNILVISIKSVIPHELPGFISMMVEQLKPVETHPARAFPRLEKRIVADGVTGVFVVALQSGYSIPAYRCLCAEPGFVCNILVDLKSELHLKVIIGSFNDALEEFRPFVRQCEKVQCQVANALFYLLHGRAWLKANWSRMISLSGGLVHLADMVVTTEMIICNLRIKNDSLQMWNRGRVFTCLVNQVLALYMVETRHELATWKAIGYESTKCALSTASLLLRICPEFHYVLARMDSTIPCIGYATGSSPAGALPGRCALSGYFQCNSLLKRINRGGTVRHNWVRRAVLAGSTQWFKLKYQDFMKHNIEVAKSAMLNEVKLATTHSPRYLATTMRLALPLKWGKQYPDIVVSSDVAVIFAKLGEGLVAEPPRVLVISLFYLHKGVEMKSGSESSYKRLDIFRRLMPLSRIEIKNKLFGRSLKPLLKDLPDSQLMLTFAYIDRPNVAAVRDVIASGEERRKIFGENGQPKSNEKGLLSALSSIVTPKKSARMPVCSICMNTGMGGLPHVDMRCLDDTLIGKYHQPCYDESGTLTRIGPVLLDSDLPHLVRCDADHCNNEGPDLPKCPWCKTKQYCSHSCWQTDKDIHQDPSYYDDDMSECETFNLERLRKNKTKEKESAERSFVNDEKDEKISIERSMITDKNAEVHWEGYRICKVDFLEDPGICPALKAKKLCEVLAAATLLIRKVMLRFLFPLVREDTTGENTAQFNVNSQYENMFNHVKYGEKFCPDTTELIVEPVRFDALLLLAYFTRQYNNFWECCGEFVVPWLTQSLSVGHVYQESSTWLDALKEIRIVAREVIIAKVILSDQVAPYVRNVRLQEMTVRRALVVVTNDIIDRFHVFVNGARTTFAHLLNIHRGTTIAALSELHHCKDKVGLNVARGKMIKIWESITAWLQEVTQAGWPDIHRERLFGVAAELASVSDQAWWVTESPQAPGLGTTSALRILVKLNLTLAYSVRIQEALDESPKIPCLSTEEFNFLTQMATQLRIIYLQVDDKISEILHIYPQIRDVVEAAEKEGLADYINSTFWRSLKVSAYSNIHATFLGGDTEAELKSKSGFSTVMSDHDPLLAVDSIVRQLAPTVRHPKTQQEIQLARANKKLSDITVSEFLASWYATNTKLDCGTCRSKAETVSVILPNGQATYGKNSHCMVDPKDTRKYFEVGNSTKASRFNFTFRKVGDGEHATLYFCLETDSAYEVTADFLCASDSTLRQSEAFAMARTRATNTCFLAELHVTESILDDVSESDASIEDLPEDFIPQEPVEQDLNDHRVYPGVYGNMLLLPPVLAASDWENVLLNRFDDMQEEKIRLVDARGCLANPIRQNLGPFFHKRTLISSILVKSGAVDKEFFVKTYDELVKTSEKTKTAMSHREVIEKILDKYVEEYDKVSPRMELLSVMGRHF